MAGTPPNPSSSRYTKLPWRLIRHYLPAWSTVFMVVIPILVARFARPAPAASAYAEGQLPPDPLPPKWLADVSLGMLSFWLWAFITNAHDGRLVRSSGQKQAEDEQERKTELAAILFFAFCNVVAYGACNHPIPVWLAFIFAAWSVGSSLIILGAPE